MNIYNLYEVPNTFLDKLLTFLSTVLLPWGNNLTITAYETKHMVMKMGLDHVPICCYPDGHILYKK
jgi:hypothetical protein